MARPAAAGAAAVPAPHDPHASNRPNPAYLAALAGTLDPADEPRVARWPALSNPKREGLVSALLAGHGVHRSDSAARRAMQG